MTHLKLTVRKTRNLMRDRLDLQAAISLQRVPSHMFYFRAMRQFRNSEVGSLVTPEPPKGQSFVTPAE